MNYKYSYIVLLLMFTLFLGGCGMSSQEETYVFTVTRMGGNNIDDIDIDSLSERNDIPLEIRLENYKMGSYSYEGSVKFAKLGWEKILKVLSALENGFIINTKGKLGPVESIIFSKLEITKSEIKGLYCLAGPTLDTTPVEFYGTRK